MLQAQVVGENHLMFQLAFYKFSQVIANFLSFVFFRLRVFRRGELPRGSGAVLAANHQSFLDPILVGLACPRPVSFMARSTLFANPLFRQVINAYGAFPVERGQTDLKAVKEALRRLKSGGFILMFPEGTRTCDGSFLMPKPGFAALASRAGVPVVPVLIKGAWQAWHRDRKFIHSLPQISVSFGMPFVVKRDFSPDDACGELKRMWEEML